MRRYLFALCVAAMMGCDQPSFEEIKAKHCAQYPDDAVCLDREDFTNILVETCIEHPEFTFCSTGTPTESKETPVMVSSHIVAAGEWDVTDEPFAIESAPSRCSVVNGTDGRPYFRASTTEATSVPGSFSVMLNGRLEPGVHEQDDAFEESGPHIEALLILDERGTLLSFGRYGPVSLARRMVIFDEIGEARARGQFVVLDLCLNEPTPAEQPPCTGFVFGTFDCAVEWFPSVADPEASLEASSETE